jgi:hypothetical protein
MSNSTERGVSLMPRRNKRYALSELVSVVNKLMLDKRERANLYLSVVTDARDALRGAFVTYLMMSDQTNADNMMAKFFRLRDLLMQARGVTDRDPEYHMYLGVRDILGSGQLHWPLQGSREAPP